MVAMYIIVGLFAGALSGLFGIGGGMVIVPALVLWAGFSQHQAQGTTLALLVLPIGLLGAWRYYQNGQVNLAAAGLICGGFVVGSYFGADLAQQLSDPLLKKIFGVMLLIVALQMLFSK